MAYKGLLDDKKQKKRPLLAPTPREDSSFIGTPTEKQIEEGPSSGDGCWQGFLASPHLKNWFLTLGLWALIITQFVCLIQLNSLCTCDCWYWWGSSFSRKSKEIHLYFYVQLICIWSQLNK